MDMKKHPTLSMFDVASVAKEEFPGLLERQCFCDEFFYKSIKQLTLQLEMLCFLTRYAKSTLIKRKGSIHPE